MGTPDRVGNSRTSGLKQSKLGKQGGSFTRRRFRFGWLPYAHNRRLVRVHGVMRLDLEDAIAAWKVAERNARHRETR